MSGIRHAPGTFCWAELLASDSAGAKEFYTKLMGWETHDDPIPGGGTYTMIRLAGGNVGALYEQPPEMKMAGVPPHWLPYVSVENAAATTQRAIGLGGSSLKDAFEVFDIGSMAVLRDPTGAVFAIWQPNKRTGTDHVDAKPGSVCWNELMTREVDRAGKFYEELFGWKREIKDIGPQPYTIFVSGDKQVAGMFEIGEELGDVPPSWMIYLSVADCDASVEEAKTLRGEIVVPPTDIPTIGRFSVLTDPQGAIFAIIKLEPPTS